MARDAKTPRVGGLADTSLSSNKLLTDTDVLNHPGGESIVANISDTYFVAQAVVTNSTNADLWFRYSDANTSYKVGIKAETSVTVDRYENGKKTQLAYTRYSPHPMLPFTLRVAIYNNAGTDTIKVYTNSDLQLSTTDDDPLPPGGVAFGGNGTLWDDAKVGHDNNGDFDIADDGDDIIWDESFGSTAKTVSYDHAGNLIDDGVFRYVYDAWNRLVKVQSSLDSGAATFQQAEFDGTGRRIKKVVTNSGDLNATIRYYYDGQKIIETRLGGAPDVPYQQFIHGTQYIDEVVMIRVKDKGDLYVHQDANWNVIGLTDLGGSLVERYAYTPYGELTVYEETGYGDYDGDGDVDSTDRAAIETGGACLGGSPPVACRRLDLDFDGNWDSADRDAFDSLPQGLARHPGRIATNVHHPFAHQGLLYEPEVGQYQNRARQYDPGKRRFVQRDPLESWNASDHWRRAERKLGLRTPCTRGPARNLHGLNAYAYVGLNPERHLDPQGLKFWGCDPKPPWPPWGPLNPPWEHGVPGALVTCEYCQERCRTYTCYYCWIPDSRTECQCRCQDADVPGPGCPAAPPPDVGDFNPPFDGGCP